MTNRSTTDIRMCQSKVYNSLCFHIGKRIFTCSWLTGIREPAKREISVEVKTPGRFLLLEVFIAIEWFQNTFRIDIIEITCHIRWRSWNHQILIIF